MVLLDFVGHEANVGLLAVITLVLEAVDRHAVIRATDPADVVLHATVGCCESHHRFSRVCDGCHGASGLTNLADGALGCVGRPASRLHAILLFFFLLAIHGIGEVTTLIHGILIGSAETGIQVGRAAIGIPDHAAAPIAGTAHGGHGFWLRRIDGRGGFDARCGLSLALRACLVQVTARPKGVAQLDKVFAKICCRLKLGSHRLVGIVQLRAVRHNQLADRQNGLRHISASVGVLGAEGRPVRPGHATSISLCGAVIVNGLIAARDAHCLRFDLLDLVGHEADMGLMVLVPLVLKLVDREAVIGVADPANIFLQAAIRPPR